MDSDDLKLFGGAAMIAGFLCIFIACIIIIAVCLADKHGPIGMLFIPFSFFIVGTIAYIIGKWKEG